jgi:hypothetical protein
VVAANSPTPRIARLSDSVPPEVNTTSDGRAPKSSATAVRASSINFFACCPKWWTLEGFPNVETRAEDMVSATLGSTGVVAL